MTGIGMLTLTGNTISMDVFGPVADNANGIGEMGYDAEAMEKEKRAATSAPARSSPTSTPWATPPRPRPRASPSARPSSPPSRSSPRFIAVIAVGSEDKISR
jgi:K(+)-stimulated pyrophosphate-energized sodium pump